MLGAETIPPYQLHEFSEIRVHEIEQSEGQTALTAILFVIALFNIHFFSVWH